jgi:hypothetical protein
MSPVRYVLGFYIPEDGILHSHRRENLRSSMSFSWSVCFILYILLCCSRSLTARTYFLSQGHSSIAWQVLTALSTVRALSSSATSVLTRATLRNIPEAAILHCHSRESLKSYIGNLLRVFSRLALCRAFKITGAMSV